MFGSKTYDQPCGRYPRIGPTANTKWFGPSIVPGPIYTSWTTSQPCSIDAGGNIFLRNETAGISEQEGTTTTKTPSGGDPAAGQSDCLRKVSQHGAPGDSCGDPVLTLGETVNGGGTLYHAGSVLRCRSAGALRNLVRGSYDGGDTHAPGSTSLRPTLRAYSAPLFLHSALFPPKSSSTQTSRGRPRVEDSTSSGGTKSTRNNSYTLGEGRRRAGGTEAPCRHRQGGYLHRYKGFEQEKVSCPPVITFRVIGGLGEFPRKRCSTAPAGKNIKHEGNAARVAGGRGVGQLQEPAASSTRQGRGGRAASACALSQETPGSLAAELSHESFTEEGRSSTYPLELFAEGSSVAPVSPPDGGAAATPAWCSRSKGRPNGAKRIKAWGKGAVQRGPPQNRAGTRNSKMSGSLTAGSKSNSRANGRFGAANANSLSYDKRSSVFLPYSLERPVSPEKTRAFFYTSN